MNETPTTSTTEPPALTAALREAADLLEQHPDLPYQPYITSRTNGRAHLAWYLPLPHLTGSDLDTQKADAATIVRALGGTWDKSEPSAESDSFNFTQKRGRLELTVQVDRPAVCERVVTGTETVTVPGRPAEPERTVEREVVEWRCQPLLADLEAVAR